MSPHTRCLCAASAPSLCRSPSTRRPCELCTPNVCSRAFVGQPRPGSSPSDPRARVLLSLRLSARKQEIIKVTEQLIEAINNGDFEAYT